MREKAFLYCRRLLLTVLMLSVLLSFIKGILISLDIDESYAAAMGYRMVRGDRLIRDMWEPHQFSAFGAALFSAPYIWLRGSADYLVIYLRTVCALIHLGLGVLMYRVLRKQGVGGIAWSVLLLHLIFLPKWIQSLEFELMHYWFLIGLFLLLYRYFTEKNVKVVLPFGGGVCLVGCILCYPTMILLFPFYLFGIYLLERQYRNEKGWRAWRGSLSFAAGSLSSGLLLAAWILKDFAWKDLPRYLSYILMDTSHGAYTMAEKWFQYLKQAGAQLQNYFISLLAAAVLVGVFGLIFQIPAVKRREGDSAGGKASFEFLLISILLTAAVVLQGRAVWGFLLEDENQFYLQGRFIAMIVPALFLCMRYRRRMALWFWLCIVPALLSVPAVLLVTNMNVNVTYSKAFIGVLGSLLVFEEYLKILRETGKTGRRIFSALLRTAEAALWVSLLVCRLLMIRVTGCLPVTLLAPLEKLETGPAAGIYVLRDTAEIWNDNYRVLKNCVKTEDRLLYIGAESLAYAAVDASAASPSMLSTVVFDELFLYYYQEHPQRLPSVVVFDKVYAEDPAYYLSYSASLQSGDFFDWLREYCAGGVIEETDHLIIVRVESRER